MMNPGGLKGALPGGLVSGGALGAREQFSLPEGDVILEWPCPMSHAGFEDFAEWLKLVQRKIARISSEHESLNGLKK